MDILFKKLNPSMHQVSVYKGGKLLDQADLDTKTYFLHDIVHYGIESELKLKNGFWGLVEQGYKFGQLNGKRNELTEELRQIERIVGPTQSLFSGHLPKDQFQAILKLVDSFELPPDFADKVLPHIESIMNQWTYLPVGKPLRLSFDIQ